MGKKPELIDEVMETLNRPLQEWHEQVMKGRRHPTMETLLDFLIAQNEATMALAGVINAIHIRVERIDRLVRDMSN